MGFENGLTRPASSPHTEQKRKEKASRDGSIHIKQKSSNLNHLGSLLEMQVPVGPRSSFSVLRWGPRNLYFEPTAQEVLMQEVSSFDSCWCEEGNFHLSPTHLSLSALSALWEVAG